MTVQEIINWFSGNYKFILNYYVILLILSLIGLLLIKRDKINSKIAHFYAVLCYATCIPGLLSIMLTIYSFFFLRQNLLTVNVLTYFVPIIAMVVLLIIIRKTIPLKQIPGFGKLSGLFMVIITSFIFTYLIQKMFFGVFFIGSFKTLLFIFLALLVLIGIGWSKIMR